MNKKSYSQIAYVHVSVAGMTSVYRQTDTGTVWHLEPVEYTQPDHVYLAYCAASTPALIITADFNRDFHLTF